MGLTVAVTGAAVALQEDTGSTAFGQSVYTAERGDTVEITVEFDNTNTSTVQVGDPGASSYYVTAQVEDRDGGGEAVVTFDSETAGSDQQVLSAAGDDAVTNVTQGGSSDGMNEPAGSDMLDAAGQTPTDGTSQTPTGTSGGSGPGFGVAVTLGAVLALALLVGRSQ